MNYVPPLTTDTPCDACRAVAREQMQHQGAGGVLAVLHQACQTALEMRIRARGGTVEKMKR